MPPKIEYEELTPEYFKQKKETQNMLEEVRFIARNNISSIQNVKNCEEWLGVKLNQFKGQRENLWRQYNNANLPEDKFEIKIKIDNKTREIETYSKELKICRRFMKRKGILKKEQQKIKKQEREKNSRSNKVKNDKVR